MDIEKQIEIAVSDAVTERPIKLQVGSRRFTINPPTIGKMQILSKYYLMLDIDEGRLLEEPQLEAMRVCKDKADIVTELMAVATFNTKKDLLDSDKINQRAEYFKWNSKVEEFSTVLLAILTQTQYENFMTSIRLTQILRQNKPK